MTQLLFGTVWTAMLTALLLAVGVHPAWSADKIRLGLAAVTPTHAPLDFAIQNNAFKKANLDVEATIFRGGGPAQEALAAGAIDIVHQVPTTVALAQMKGVKQRCVFSAGSQDGWYIVVLPDSSIKSMKDLNGKSIGITTKGSTSDMFTLWALSDAGVKARTVTLGSVAAEMAALKGKQIEAAIVSPTPSYRILASQEAISILDFGKSMPHTPSCYVASEELISRNPESLRRFLRVLSDTIVYLQNNEEVAVRHMKAYTKDDDDAVAKSAVKINLQTMDPFGITTDDGVKSSLNLNFLAGLGEVNWPVGNVYTNEFAPRKQ